MTRWFVGYVTAKEIAPMEGDRGRRFRRAGGFQPPRFPVPPQGAILVERRGLIKAIKARDDEGELAGLLSLPCGGEQRSLPIAQRAVSEAWEGY